MHPKWVLNANNYELHLTVDVNPLLYLPEMPYSGGGLNPNPIFRGKIKEDSLEGVVYGEVEKQTGEMKLFYRIDRAMEGGFQKYVVEEVFTDEYRGTFEHNGQPGFRWSAKAQIA